MTDRPTTFTIRNRQLGVLIRSARQASGRSATDCAQATGVPSERFDAYELGESAPSLPELEMLAYYLGLPLENFWSRDVLNPPARPDLKRLLPLRQNVIGALLRQARQEAGLSVEDLAARTHLPQDRLAAYELGQQPVPLPELETLAASLDRAVADFQDRHGPVGRWAAHQRALAQLSELPPDLLEFLLKPVNRPYLDLARRLSEMSVEKLRAVAEGLLEITL
ncbi:MAG TPA: helix-turn-helix transcriptional regulator [Anaerolineales bacterium]|nr:helix-turn-helix transcriptional regulator [Anaerolineales bacterium]